jgi:hypothetical protein
MPKLPKKVTELPDKKAIRKLFPKEVVEEIERIAHQGEETTSPPKKS